MKTIKVFEIELELTPERRRRVESALRETKRHLEKELAYSEDLQNVEAIAFLEAHIEKLEGMLE